MKALTLTAIVKTAMNLSAPVAGEYVRTDYGLRATASPRFALAG